MSNAADIRKAIKSELGLNSRTVSVRTHLYFMESTVYVEVKDHNINLASIKEIAKRYETIHRRSYTGEILSGGNSYVEVGYSSEAEKALAEKYSELLTEEFFQPLCNDFGLIKQVGPISIWVEDNRTVRFKVEGEHRQDWYLHRYYFNGTLPTREFFTALHLAERKYWEQEAIAA